MSSEVAAYSPNALASTSERPTSVRSELQFPTHTGNVAQLRPEILKSQEKAVTHDTELEDEYLLEQVSCGATEALSVLFHRHSRMVRGIAYRIVRNASEADDLLQEVFLHIFRKARNFDATKGAARSWIVQATYQRAIDRRRHLASRHFYDRLELDSTAVIALKTEIAFYETSLEGMLGKDLLVRIEESLSVDQRRTLQLHFFEGHTIEEIAQEMGQSSGNVRHHYYRALEKMRRLILPSDMERLSK